MKLAESGRVSNNYGATSVDSATVNVLELLQCEGQQIIK